MATYAERRRRRIKMEPKSKQGRRRRTAASLTKAGPVTVTRPTAYADATGLPEVETWTPYSSMREVDVMASNLRHRRAGEPVPKFRTLADVMGMSNSTTRKKSGKKLTKAGRARRALDESARQIERRYERKEPSERQPSSRTVRRTYVRREVQEPITATTLGTSSRSRTTTSRPSAG